MKDKNKMLLILGSMAFLANGDNYAAAPLLINISKDLNLTVSTAAMSVTAYMLAFGVFTLLFGPLSDRFGKVRVINTAAIGTAIFSILGATTFNLSSLIFFRSMNGAFGAGIFPVTIALIGESFDPEDRQKALGKLMGFMFLGAATASALGGAIAYFGSWRIVYLIYGVGELILAIMMLKILERDKPVVDKLNFFSAYKNALTNYRFMRTVLMVFLVGFSVFGSFTYSGKLIQELTGYNILSVGLILSIFGIGTVIGGKIAPEMRKILKHGFLVTSGLIGGLSMFVLSIFKNIWILSLGLLGFGLAFVCIQSTLILMAQEKLPKMKGTAMSVVSFNLFVGGAIGTSVGGLVMESYGITKIFHNNSYIILTVGILTSIFVARFEMRKNNSNVT